MDRRNALKSLIVASGGVIALPAWATSWKLEDVVSHRSSFLLTEQDVLVAVVDTIIPAGDAIGALSVGVDKFLMKLLEDCYEKDVQDNVKKQLNNLEASAQRLFQKSFLACAQNERENLLISLSKSEVKEERDFFELMKAETIRGFNTSREVMVNYYQYKVAPGHYYGCVDLKA